MLPVWQFAPPQDLLSTNDPPPPSLPLSLTQERAYCHFAVKSQKLFPNCLDFEHVSLKKEICINEEVLLAEW